MGHLRRLGFVLLLLVLFVLGIGASLWITTPDVKWLQTINPRETAMMLYREERGRQTGQPTKRTQHWVKLSQISPHLIRSVIATEDHMFFQHHGFNWKSIREALKANLQQGRIVKGGSTITQQLAKNLSLNPSQNLFRKIREALIAYRLERELTKERILELYLNVIEWGPGIYGAEAAAQTYFHKGSSELSLSESIRLASSLRNPYRFSPLDDKNKWTKRKQHIIALEMRQWGWIDRSTLQEVLKELHVTTPLQHRPKTNSEE